MNHPSDKLLTSHQVADLLSVTIRTLAVWCYEKRYPLKFVKVGRNVRYRASDVQSFLDLRTVK
jgi:excisionase family DNA binding protein